METFVSVLVSSILNRWNEVDKLLDVAELAEPTDQELHDALCRGAVVLSAANLEGFVRASAKAVIEDANRFGEFRSLPSACKRSFCRTFIPEEGKEPIVRSDKLILQFDQLNAKLTLDAFMVSTRFDGQKNPSPSVIDKVTSNFGVKNSFNRLAESELDEVFLGIPSTVEQIQTGLLQHLQTGTTSFPYSIDLDAFQLKSSSPPPKGTRTLWESFVDDFMQRRHRIAHGSVSDNHDSVDELRSDRNKIIVLQLGILMLLCGTMSD